MSKSIQDSSFSLSRRYFSWRKKIGQNEDDFLYNEDDDNLTFNSFLPLKPLHETKPKVSAMSKIKSLFHKPSSVKTSSLGTKLVGTIFGYRKGHVHFAFQEDSKQKPAFLVELATPTCSLVKEMASGLVRIALECDKSVCKKPRKLLEEPLWRTYCNGKKCGYAIRRECGIDDWRVLSALQPISSGAGVLPEIDGEILYMRAKFERVAGNKDSESFYMMNPDHSGCPELSFYLLRA